MLYKRFLPACIAFSLLIACNSNTHTNSDTIFVNNSGHRILIASYSQGKLMSNSEIQIAVSQNAIYKTGNRGLSTGGTSYASHMLPADSIIVTYDESIKKSHHSYKNLGGTNGIKYDDPRNLLNEKNYVLNIRESTKKRQELEYRYTFSKEDYEEALK